MAEAVNKGLFDSVDLQAAWARADCFHLKLLQSRLHLDHLKQRELQRGAMEAAGQADSDPARLLGAEAMEPQGCEQAENRLGNPLSDDLQIEVVPRGRRWQPVNPPLQALQQAALAQPSQGRAIDTSRLSLLGTQETAATDQLQGRLFPVQH